MKMEPFIGFSKRSLKSVLHMGKKSLSLPVADFTQLKESYDNIEILLNKICYSDYQRSLCGDLKVLEQ